MLKRMIVMAAALGLMAGVSSAAELKFSGAGSKIEFVGTKTKGRHDGGFKEFTGTIAMPGNDITQATIKVEIQNNSLYSDVTKLTNHLKSPDFFDVRTYPTSTFVSTAIKPTPAPAGGATHQITGDLTLHGVTKSISFPVKVTAGANGATIEGTFTIQKEAFNMTYGKGQINNDVTIKVSVKAAP
jgi:polyisoprenoid-binding protein YceI